MMPEMNRRLVLQSRPDGIPGPEHFALEEAAIGEPGPGEVLVRNVYLSVDPARRGWVNAVANYSTPVAIGEVMRALAVGEVVRSAVDDLPEGSFKTNLGNMRVTYNFTPSIFVQSLIQYNDRSDRWSTNLRFHWLQTAGTGLFVVYNDTESLEGAGPVNRAFIVKYVQQFDVLR